ncbi:MAG TPA: tRNA 2-selenouridine(34) synthase MnmH [Casimicrobiaceae bacterium]|jgi:tRNA 2-selenouridine synthase|nr:tRNA 2-selenouridine(34) synthase MnmH [Casimicrobiaceae bacterium]
MSSPDPGVRRVSVDALAEYPERIDVRSPAEYAIDHAVGAANHPVLNDDERATIGTLYARSPFEARKLGAAVVARNIATMLETAFMAQTRDWRPLVYCWRGGQRSRALTQVLLEVGWRAAQLEGGYRAYRRHVVAELARLPARFDFVVICGLTGSGKSRLLAALADAGAQTLDLEAVARHRGSLLGDIPGDAQPSQKWFESQLFDAFAKLDPARPVYVESESRRIGTLQMPEALVARMRDGRRVTMVTPVAERIALLKEEYAHYFAAPNELSERLEALTELRGKATIARWKAMAAACDWDALVAELLEGHYDPTYARSLGRNFPREEDALTLELQRTSRADFIALARELRELVEVGAAVAG